MRSATTDSKTPYNYACTSTPKAAWSHRYNAAKNKRQTDRSRNRRTHEVPFVASCSHFTRKNTRFRAPASSPKQSPCNIHAAIPMRSATTASTNAQNYAHRNNHCCKTHRRNQTTPAAPAAHTRYLSSPAAATLHGKTQGFVLWLPPHNIAHATFMQPWQCHLPATTLHQGQVSIAHHPSRSSLNRTPPFKVKSQSRSTLQGQVSIRSATTLHQGHVKSHTTLQGQVSIAHHPSRSSLNRTPPFKVKSQSRTTLQGQVSIAHHPSHHPSRSSGQVSIAHHPFSIAHHPSRSSLNRTPPFKVKCQSRTTLHHFKTQNSICPYLGSIASQLPLIMVRGPVCCILIQLPHWFLHRCRFLVIARYCRFSLLESTCLSRR